MTEQPSVQPLAGPIALFGQIRAQASSMYLLKPLLGGYSIITAQASSTGYLTAAGSPLPANSVRIPLGHWPVGGYVLALCTRTDATGAPAALTVGVLVNMVQVASGNLYAATDSASASYPTTWATYDAQLAFNLTAPSDIVVRVTNPGSYHAAGKHLWIRAVQLHRTS